MKLTKQEKQVIISIITKYFINEDVTIILFGSYAKGNADSKSDIDIAIKLPCPLPTSKWSYIEEDFENSDLLQIVDVVDYARVNDNFKSIIDKEGIILN